VDRVNNDNRFLAKVTRVIVFGSYLRTGKDKLSDVDIAVELAPKESEVESPPRTELSASGTVREKGPSF
jgi:predicted nucleotidyltransferase